MPATFKANERCYNRTFGLYGLETLNHRSELKILWDTFRSQNFGFHMIAGSQTSADDRRRSQKIEHGSIFCDRLRSRSQDRRSVFPYDRRRSQNFLRSAIVCDHMETSLKNTTSRMISHDFSVFPEANSVSPRQLFFSIRSGQ